MTLNTHQFELFYPLFIMWCFCSCQLNVGYKYEEAVRLLSDDIGIAFFFHFFFNSYL